MRVISVERTSEKEGQVVNQVILKGNLAQPPYFDYVGDTGRPFMRLYLAVDRPVPRSTANTRDTADFFRVVSYDDLALFAYPYLQPGSEVLVVGRLRARKRRLANGKRQTVIEIIARDITFLRKINWKDGDAERERILRQRASSQSERPKERARAGEEAA